VRGRIGSKAEKERKRKRTKEDERGVRKVESLQKSSSSHGRVSQCGWVIKVHELV
jgi:hypothetical protein